MTNVPESAPADILTDYLPRQRASSEFEADALAALAVCAAELDTSPSQREYQDWRSDRIETYPFAPSGGQLASRLGWNDAKAALFLECEPTGGKPPIGPADADAIDWEYTFD